MIFLQICSWIILISGVSLLTNVLLNGAFFRILSKTPKTDQREKVSVIIPARNEEEHLPSLLNSLINQTYKNIEILVINDQSTDKTQTIIEEFEKKDIRVRGYKTEVGLKKSEHGKINAMLQLIPYATGSYLLNIDADTELLPDCIEYALSILKGRNLDIVSGFPKQRCKTFLTGTLISAMMLSCSFIPHWLNYFIKSRVLTVAIGQFILSRKSAFDQVGGFENMDRVVCDDMALARRFVENKKHFAFIDISQHIECQMYDSMMSADFGIGRSIAGLFKTSIPYLVLLIFVYAIVLLMAFAPVVGIISILITGSYLGLIGFACLWLGWFIADMFASYPFLVSASYSVTFVQTVVMVVRCVHRKLTKKKVYWKGREVRY